MTNHPPTRPTDYAALNGVYGALLMGTLLALRDTDERLEALDLARLAGATFALSKVVGRERIGTWVREPFADESADRRRAARADGACSAPWGSSSRAPAVWARGVRWA